MTDHWGIDDRYYDALGIQHVTSWTTRAALLAAMGVAPDPAAVAEAHVPENRAHGHHGPPSPAAPPIDDDLHGRVKVVRAGESPFIAAPGRLTLEDGTVIGVERALPPDLPIGYHHLEPRVGREQTLVIVTPGACHLPDDLRTWGWAAQVYAARSRASWGIGDFADLRRLGKWSREALGAGVIMVNPFTAPTPVRPIEASPYYPSSRRFRNPLFLRIEEVPGAAEALGANLPRLAEAGLALNHARRIDRDAIFALKMEALEGIFDQFTGDAGFDGFWKEQGDALTQFATYCVLAERHGKDWRRWPREYRRPDSVDVARFVTHEARRVRFHAWLQWLIDDQLARAAQGDRDHQRPAHRHRHRGRRRLVLARPAGQRRVGGRAARRVQRRRPGLGPDAVHPAPPARRRLPVVQSRPSARCCATRAACASTTSWACSGCSGSRAAWARRAAPTCARAPTSCSRSSRSRVSARARSSSARTWAPSRRACARSSREQRMLSYRLLYFEPGAGARVPRDRADEREHARPGDDRGSVDRQRRRRSAWRIGLAPNEAGMRALRDKIAREAAIPADATPEVAIERTYAALAEAPSRVLLATLDDALAVVGASQHARHRHRVAQLVARAAAAARGDGGAGAAAPDRAGHEARTVEPMRVR